MIKKITAVFAIVLFALSGCVESPTDVGSSLLPSNDKFDIKVVRTDTLNIEQRSNYFKSEVELGAASRILLGKINGLTSTALLRFYILMPDSVERALSADSLTVKAAWVEIKPNYFLGDKTLPFGFDVFGINNFWLPAGFNKDSLKTLDFNPTPVGNLSNPPDTLMKFSLSNDLAFDWLKKATDEEHPENNGILLKPTDETQRIIGFQAITNIKREDEPVLKIIVEKNGAFTDTLTENITSDVHVITGKPEIKDSTNINLLGNYTLRGCFYFDDSFLPKDAIINKAIFSLHIDSTSSLLGNVPSDSIVVEMCDGYCTDSTLSNTEVYLTKRSWGYEGNIAYIIQKWINGTTNTGLRLSLSNELRTLNLVSLFSEKCADVSRRPKVVVYYTDKK